MPYGELTKNFENIRDYMREFYLYGFKSRDEFDKKSARTYDDTRRRIESFLSDYMSFRYSPDGKTLFISIDSRNGDRNPFFKAWKSKSFTDGDITLHFILFDILESDRELSLKDITSAIDACTTLFEEPRIFDESTVRKKLREYEAEGLVISRREGRQVFYRCAPSVALPTEDLLRFFSEVMPLGVVGSFLEDKRPLKDPVFRFKHHYLTSVLDSEVLLTVFLAMGSKSSLNIKSLSRRKGRASTACVIPLQVRAGAGTGRQHLLCFSLNYNRFTSLRIDSITDISIGDPVDYYDDVRAKFRNMEKNIWGVSLSGRLEHVEFDIRADRLETYIPERLEREKRCGTVTRIDEETWRYSVDCYDACELFPWIRTFIGRLVRIEMSDKELEARFRNDILVTYRMYGGSEDAVL